MVKAPTRKCEVTYAYAPAHEDELELVLGETIEILREVKAAFSFAFMVTRSLKQL